MTVGAGRWWVASGALAAGILAAITVGLTRTSGPSPPALPVAAGVRPADERSDPLPAGERAAFAVAGWVNGPPPASEVVVLDVWSAWCQGCREAAPDLVEARRRHPDVGFVSVTNMGEPAVRSFAEQFGITWPCGYGASLDTIAGLGAANPGQPIAGYEVRPTLYLLGPGGRVLWNDGQARFRHRKAAVILAELDAEIGKAVGSAPKQAEPSRRQRERDEPVP